MLARGQPLDYPHTVLTTWELAFDRIKETPGATELLDLAAYLAPDAIPLDLLANVAAILPPPLAAILPDAVLLDDALAALHSFSLIERLGDETISLHRLVQLVTRDRHTPDERTCWATAAVEAINAALTGDPQDARTWPVLGRLLAHGLVVSDHAETMGLALPVAAQTLNQIGTYLYGRAELATAKALFERALVIDRAAYGDDHPDVARDLNNLAGVLRQQGDLAGAIAAHRRALAIYHIFDRPHQEGVTVYHLAELALALGRPAAALRLFAITYLIDRALGHPDADAADLPRVRQVAATLGYG